MWPARSALVGAVLHLVPPDRPPAWLDRTLRMVPRVAPYIVRVVMFVQTLWLALFYTPEAWQTATVLGTTCKCCGSQVLFIRRMVQREILLLLTWGPKYRRPRVRRDSLPNLDPRAWQRVRRVLVE